jgi:hypothetical protein
MLGLVFITCHMMCIMMQSVMMMKVFFKVPKKLGYFPEFEESESTSSVNNEDDAYKADV